MNPVEASVSQITAPATEGRRERKKQRTRDTLIEAAMELFAAKGYDRTTVHEITDAVDVSERTFFRYFASKEDLALSFVRDGAATFATALAARPPDEEPLTAARAAFHISLRQLAGNLPSYLSVIRLIETTPALLAAHLRYVHEHDDEVIQVLAEREGVAATDPRPRVLAAVIGSVVFLANREWLAAGREEPEAMAAAFDRYADEVRPALAGHWTAR
jgi:AcrR family transcriptional regulator